MEAVDKIKQLKTTRPLMLLSDLHAVMSDEEYAKVAGFLTLDSDNRININTAPADVLSSVLPATAVSEIVNRRKENQISSLGEVGLNQQNTPASVLNSLAVDSAIFRVYCYVTVGGYTKQVEAVVNNGSRSFWRGL